MHPIEKKKKEIQTIINLIGSKKYEKAIQKTRPLIKKYPKDYIFYNALGIALMNTAEYDKSLEILEKAI